MLLLLHKSREGYEFLEVHVFFLEVILGGILRRLTFLCVERYQVVERAVVVIGIGHSAGGLCRCVCAIVGNRRREICMIEE